MDRNAVLVKTVKGTEEVKSRTHGLAARLRSVLIMVDGKSAVAEYAVRFAAIPDIEGSLRMLLEQGYVEAQAGAPTAPPPVARPAAGQPSPAAAPQAPLPGTQKEAVGELSRMLLDSMGPDADVFTGQIERARNRADFVAAAERCVRVLEGLGARGKARAAQFSERAALVAERFFGD